MQLTRWLGIAPSTVHRILTDAHPDRLSHVGRTIREPVRLYEHGRPGRMIHVDVTKHGNIPDVGGWCCVG